VGFSGTPYCAARCGDELLIACVTNKLASSVTVMTNGCIGRSIYETDSVTAGRYTRPLPHNRLDADSYASVKH